MERAIKTVEKSRRSQARASHHAPTITRRPAPASEDVLGANAGRCACGGSCPRCERRRLNARPRVTLDPGILSGGRRLTESQAAPMEAGFGQPLSHLRLHTDARGARLADALDAEALTVGPHIFFAADRSPNDRPLLTHEVAHALQQPAQLPDTPMSVTQPGDASERAAEQAAHAVSRGMPAHPGSATGAQIARKGLSSWAWEKLEDPGKFLDEVIEHPFDATAGAAGGAAIEGLKEDVQQMRETANAIRERGDAAERWLVEKQKEGTASLYADANEHADVPVIGSALQANAWVIDQMGQFGTGVTGGAVTLGSGLLSASANPVDTAGGLLTLGNELANPFAEKGPAVRGIWEAVAKPYERAISEDRWSEAGGRLFFDVVSTLAGGSEASAAGKSSRAVPVAKVGAKIDPLAKTLPVIDPLAKTLPVIDPLGKTLPAADDLAKTLPKPAPSKGSGPAFAETERVPQPTLPGIGPEPLAKSALPEGLKPLAGPPPIPSSVTEALAAAQARRLVRPQYGTFHQVVWEYLGGKGPAPISYRFGNKWFIDGERVPTHLRDLVEDQIASGAQRP